MKLPLPPNAMPPAATVAEQLEPRVQRLVARFNGAIKYLPMLMDHGEHVADPSQHWTDEQCVEYAKALHAVAIERLKVNRETWNNGIPYARNIPTQEMLEEAGWER